MPDGLRGVVGGGGVLGEDWTQWRGPGRDGVWRERGILENFPAKGLTARWSAPVGWGYSSPVTGGGRVFVTDAELVGLASRERVHCFDEATGKLVWDYGYEVKYAEKGFIDANNKSGPAATPIVEGERLYTLGRCGDLICFEAGTGRVVWRKDLEKAYPGRTLQCNASPLIEGDLLIVVVGAKPGACVVAFDKVTGKEAWRALDEGATNSSPIVVTAGGARQLIVWTQESVTSLEPATGKGFWRQKLVTSSEYVVSTPVVAGDRLLIGGLMMKLEKEKPGAVVVWPKSKNVTRRVLSNTSSPMIEGEEVYSARSTGELECLDAGTGETLWETNKVTELAGGASIHLTKNGDSVLLYTDRGELIRARLSRKGYEELSRAKLIEPTCQFGARRCAWAMPAYSNGCVIVRNDVKLVSYSLTAER